MSQDSESKQSRRQLLGQGLNASLGFVLFPKLFADRSKLLEQHSLLTLATIPDPNSVSETVSLAPITAAIHFTAKSNQAEALVTQLTQALPEARKTPGCRYAQLYVTAGNPNQVILFKSWDNRISQAKYLQWEKSSGRLAKLLAFVEGDPIVEYWEFQAT